MTRAACLLLPLLLLAACGGSRTPYPPPAELRQAPQERQEFVDAFLQGRWCEAEMLFARSVDGYLRTDDVCAAAYSHLLAYKLKSYAGEDDPEALAAARRYLAMGSDCPDLPGLPGQAEASGVGPSPKDRTYLDLLATHDFGRLESALAAEPDALYASVYGRKAARAALAAGHPDQARSLIEAARRVDARQGWVVFLVNDWTFKRELSSVPAEREAITARLTELEKRIIPCTH